MFDPNLARRHIEECRRTPAGRTWPSGSAYRLAAPVPGTRDAATVPRQTGSGEV